MHKRDGWDRRTFLKALSSMAVIPVVQRCAPAMPTPTPTPTPTGEFEAPQRLQTTTSTNGDGSMIVRAFEGRSAPQDLSFVESSTGARRRLYELFPRSNCPFAIDTTRALGADGMALSVPDRTLMGVIPTESDAPWALNMVPFGVAIDGVLMDPSGPWYDGGAPDPQNPFDRACSGWEYDPIFASVAQLVGVPTEVRGHVQPGRGGMPGSPGLFHYHGVPALMLGNLRASQSNAERERPLVVGYSGDGFWVIDATIPAAATRARKKLHLFSGYVLREGARAAVAHSNPALVPTGSYDGTYVQDWQHDVAAKRALIERALQRDGQYLGLSQSDVDRGAATYAILDARNGITTDDWTLPGAPSRAYVYVVTPDWPEIPRWFAFEPSESFRNNVVPFASGGMMAPPGRQQLYDACTGTLADVHQWNGRAPY